MILESLRSSHVQCWVDLLRLVASRPEAINHVVPIRTGLKEIPAEVAIYILVVVCSDSFELCTNHDIIPLIR